jgi:hypothetical protein
MPAATVPVVASSITMNEPVARTWSSGPGTIGGDEPEAHTIDRVRLQPVRWLGHERRHLEPVLDRLRGGAPCASWHMHRA